MTSLTRAFATKGANGTFIRTPEQMAQDQRAADMRSLGYTYQQIGDAMGVTRQAAYVAVQRAIADIPNEGAIELRQMELAKLDRLERYYHTVLGKEHVKVGNTGKIVKDDDGKPVLDESPRMDAATGLLKVQAQRARLLGLNAPTVTRGEVVVYDVDRDSAAIVEAQMKALEAIGLGDRVDEFKRVFVAALGSGGSQVIDAEWTTA